MSKAEDKDDGVQGIAKEMRAANPWLTAISKLTGGAVFGVLGGYFLDRWLGTEPWGLVGLSTVGIGVGFYGFIREALRLGKK